MDPKPTPEQQKIIDEPSNCVVIARPGSGKTSTLSWKIKSILEKLPDYKGVIAISYTNKASYELERRCLSKGINQKASFFGTIDKFFIAEIIMPFGRHIFGRPVKELAVVQLKDIQEELKKHQPETPIADANFLGQLYQDGKILLESVGYFATYIFDQSHACQRYLKARYSHVLIDEYQDCGEWQHVLFMKLAQLGMGSIAVGDIDQSIFAFAGKSSRFLAALIQHGSNFVPYRLTENHRCHSSIVNYASRLLSASFELLPIDAIYVYEKRINGSEVETARWLSDAVSRIEKDFDIQERNKIAVLVKSNAARDLADQYLTIPHKSFRNTSLDEDSSLWGGLFRNVLIWVFSPEITKHELVERYLNADYQASTTRKVMRLLRRIEDIAKRDVSNLGGNVKLFIELASILLPHAQNRMAVEQLTQVLSEPSLRGSFVPAKSSEIQLMTLHKAKGMEFEIVFHLNLHRWILPQYQGDRTQDLHLHYVGITRAKKCCVLCTSTQRYRGAAPAPAEDSEFLQMNGLSALRVECPY